MTRFGAVIVRRQCVGASLLAHHLRAARAEAVSGSTFHLFGTSAAAASCRPGDESVRWLVHACFVQASSLSSAKEAFYGKTVPESCSVPW